MGVSSFRLDTDRFPQEVSCCFSPGLGLTICDGDKTVRGCDIRSVWYRRNVKSGLPSVLSEGYTEFCQRESRALLEGALLSLPTTRWLSDPSAIWRAEHKPYQLAVASALGFAVPDTLITNSAARVREFGASRQLVAKAVSSGYVITEAGTGAIFTSLVSGDDLTDLRGLELSPVTFQELQIKKADIRVTVVGDVVMAAEILSQERDSSKTDWRATDDPNLRHRIHNLPSDIAELCRLLVQSLGLNFGAVDLAQTNDGAYVFFEINPNGEWAWLEYQLGLPISSSIATWLAS